MHLGERVLAPILRMMAGGLLKAVLKLGGSYTYSKAPFHRTRPTRVKIRLMIVSKPFWMNGEIEHLDLPGHEPHLIVRRQCGIEDITFRKCRVARLTCMIFFALFVSNLLFCY